MQPIEQFIQHYYQGIQNDPNSYQVFNNSTQEFFNSFSHYVVTNLQGLMLSGYPYHKDEQNNAIYLEDTHVSQYLTLQPVIHLNENNKIYNLNFIVKLNLQNGFIAEEFCYLHPNNFDKAQQIFIYTLYIIQYYLDNNAVSNFYNFIHQLNSSLSSYIVSENDSKNQNTNEANDIENSSTDLEEDLDADRQLFKDFVVKYNQEKVNLYEQELLDNMEKDKEIIFMNLSKFLSDKLIHKHFKINRLVETLENYTSIYDATHLDKEIYLSAHYYPNFTIRPILEYSYLKEEMSNEPMVTIDFFKFDISLFNPSNKQDKFNAVITLIPYKKDHDFSDFLDLFILLRLNKLSLFNKDVDDPIETMNLLPFLDALSDELMKVIDMMKNPMLKRNREANFLNDNRNFNERELENYIER